MLQTAMADLTRLVTTQPDQSPRIADSLPRFRDALDVSEASGSGTLQYPARFTDLGALYVLSDDPVAAESVLRRSLELDAHQPAAHVWLALSVIAQGDDAKSEAEAAVAEAGDDIWQSSGTINSTDMFGEMSAIIDQYVARYPDRGDSVTDLRTMLTPSTIGSTSTP
jgi:hypothetical protein